VVGRPDQGLSDSKEGLWLELDELELKDRELGSIRLDEVTSESHWQAMLAIRMQVERAFGIVDEEVVQTFIDEIRKCQRVLGGRWYVARAPGYEAYVGEVGLVPFEFGGRRVGRLQDVDIVPCFQGRGFGNALLDAIIHQAKCDGLQALCLLADVKDWPRHWYRRRGFVPVVIRS
jgi:GNAT superfamily N-acetyltransferase